jgi:Kef-type K+ transport system membrane component KefB
MARALNPVPPVGAHHLLVFLVQAGLLLMLAVILGQVAVRLRMPAVVGELCAGVLLGPSLLGHAAPGLFAWLFSERAEQLHLLEAVGQFAVLLLVGITGIHLDFGLVRRRGATAVRISVAGLVVPLGLGVATGYALPAALMPGTVDRTVFALFLGVAMCVSAIPVIAKTLMDMNLIHRNVGQLTLAAGVVDDTFGWLMLSVVSAMATTGVRVGHVVVSCLYLVGFVVAALTVGRLVVHTAMRAAMRSPEPGLPAAVTVVMLVLAAAATHAMGLEAVLGAFACGILIGSCRGLDLTRLASLRVVVLSVLAPLFFATAGLRMDLSALGRPAVLLAAIAVLSIAILGKFSGACVGALASGLSRWEALALGAGMNARGVIEVVVATVGLRLGVLIAETYTIVVLVAIVTSLMAAPILRASMARVEQTPEERMRQARAVILAPVPPAHSWRGGGLTRRGPGP